MPIAGFRRFRKVQVGINQSSITSNVSATRQLSYRGPLHYEPNRTQPDVDTGSLDPILASFFGAVDVTSPWTGNQSFDELPYIYALGIKGGVSPTGSATGRIWTYQAASLTADPFDYATQQWGDDVTYDIITGGGGVINDWSLSFGEDLSAFDTTANLFYARAAFGSNSGFTGGLTLDASPEWLYGAHTVVYMDVNAAAIGTTPILNAVHALSFSVNNNLDKKRFADGSNVGFNLQGFGRGPREIEFKLTLAKTVQTVTEAQTIDDVPVPTRYFDIKTTSTEIIPGGTTPFSNSIRFPAELIARDDGEIENNTTIELTYRGKYDATLAYALRCVVVNTLSALQQIPEAHMPELIPVRVRDCVHPDTPHDDPALGAGDFVYLRPTLSLDGGIRATQDYQAVLSSPISPADMATELTRRWLIDFVRDGAVGANFIDPFDVDVILSDYSIAAPVSEKANDLYGEAVLRPLGLGPQATSPRGPTNGSTSRTKRSTRTSPV